MSSHHLHLLYDGRYRITNSIYSNFLKKKCHKGNINNIRMFSKSSLGNENANNEKYKRAVRPGQFKSPMTDHLWHVREEAKKNHSIISGTSDLIPQPPRTSEVCYKFSEDPTLVENYINPFNKIRVGKILEDLDALAGNIALQHCSADGKVDTSDLMLVTASIDRVTVKHHPNLKDDITLSGKVIFVGSSSLQISMKAVSSWTDEPWLNAKFTFVGRNRATNKSFKVNPLLLTDNKDKIVFNKILAQNEKKKTSFKGPKARKIFKCSTFSSFISKTNFN